MKKEIIAYITALLDVCNHTVNIPITECLDNLIDFIEDIPEEKEQSIKTFNIVLENQDLKQSNEELLSRITELNQLEEANEYLKNINENLYKKVENLEIALSLSRSGMDPIFKENLKKVFARIK